MTDEGDQAWKVFISVIISPTLLRHPAAEISAGAARTSKYAAVVSMRPVREPAIDFWINRFVGKTGLLQTCLPDPMKCARIYHRPFALCTKKKRRRFDARAKGAVASKWITSRKVRFIVSEGSTIENAEPSRNVPTPERLLVKTLDFYARPSKIIGVRSKRSTFI